MTRVDLRTEFVLDNGKVHLSLYMQRSQKSGIMIQLHLFFTSALVVDEWSVWGSGRFTWKMGHRYPWIGSWVGPRSFTDILGNMCITFPARIRTHAFQPVAETLHWLLGHDNDEVYK